MDNRARVVVTGIGVVTSVGIGVESFWEAILAGQSGISPVESFDTQRYSVHLGGEVKNFDPSPFVRRLRPGSMSRASQLAIASSRLALKDAGLTAELLDPISAGV